MTGLQPARPTMARQLRLAVAAFDLTTLLIAATASQGLGLIA